MLKFKGKPKELRGFLQYLLFTYGKNEKVINILKGENKNVYL